jgi:hypothetical protein
MSNTENVKIDKILNQDVSTYEYRCNQTDFSSVTYEYSVIPNKKRLNTTVNYYTQRFTSVEGIKYFFRFKIYVKTS